MVKKVSIFLILALGVAFVANADLGDLKLLKRERFIFENKDCEKNDSCSLKNVRYLIEDYRIEMRTGFNYGTRLFAEYETDTIESLEEYVFVNYIKGCAFESATVGIPRNTIASNSQTGQDFKYLDWTLDSFDNDPVYNSYPGLSRHYSYRWNTSWDASQDYYNQNNDVLYGRQKPEMPRLFVSDRPSTAFVSELGTVKNLSLEFKMCIFKAKDVPSSMSADDKMGEPIYCYNWSSSWIYNHSEQKYETPYGISPVCK